MKAQARVARSLAAPFFPRVELAADWPERAGRFAAAFEAELARREGGGRGALLGSGHELAGHRPYRAGDDPRTIDWNVTARSDRPFVRVTRRDARERWRVVVDSSASMGVGPPGKLTRAAEVAGALALFGVRRDAEVELVLAGHAPLVLRRRVPGALHAVARELSTWSAAPAGTPPAAFEAGGPARGLARCIWIGDPFALDPRAVFERFERVPARHVLHVCAPHELAPPALSAAVWHDAESERSLLVPLDARARADYARELELALAAWSDAARRRGARHAVGSSAQPFEELARAALGA